ncbi:MAG: hypothetical protein AAGL10_15700 [Pseudomonadota bacterium]
MNDQMQNKNFAQGARAATGEVSQERDWRKSMSDHVAYALLVYTGLQIFVTIKALAQGVSSILPYIALVVLVAAIIPACRWFEKRWTGLSDAEASDTAFASAFRRDIMALWVLAIGLPFALTAIFKMMFAAG